MRFHRHLAAALALVGALALQPAAARAEAVTVTDVAGRRVTVNAPVERVILGEGRQIYLLAALDREDPFRRVVGWRDDFAKADPNGYAAYLARNPRIASLPTFGGMKEGAFDIEQAVALRPDVVFMNIESRTAVEGARLVERLAIVGIPVIYVDFRERPFENTETSMRLFGRLLGREDRAEAFIAFRASETARVTERLQTANVTRPLVMIDRAGGYSDACCMSFGRENFGRMVELAGGRNLAADLIPGTFGEINPEHIVAANPDVVIVTGGNWDAYVPGGAWVGLGPGSDLAEARLKLAALTQRPAFTTIAATRNHRVHGIWHQFYNSPYQFVAIQQIARWLHPELFGDLDPEATLRTLHERFLPVPYQPGYWVSLAGER